MKKTLKIVGRVALGIGLALYIVVAALNYSVVQSYLGAWAGHRMSQEWGGTVRIGSLHAMPWNHLIADDLLLVSPDGDTIFKARTLRLRFRRFPYHRGNIADGGNIVGGLVFDRVYLSNAYYHFERYEDNDPYGHHKNNLGFIIDHYRKDKPKKHHGHVFTVDVGTLTLNHVHYRMDLPDRRKKVYDKGVEIPHMEFLDICGKIKDVHVANDDVQARIVRLQTQERSGFRVEQIKGKVHVCRTGIKAEDLLVVTPDSHIEADASLSYGHWKVMKHYLHTVDHHLVVRDGTAVAMSDVAYWAPVLWGQDYCIEACGALHGRIDSLTVDSLRLACDDRTTLALAGKLAGLPHIHTLTGTLDYLRLQTDADEAVRLSAKAGAGLPPALVKWIDRTGHIEFSAEGQGSYAGKANATATLSCLLGDLHADLKSETSGQSRTLDIDAQSGSLDLSLLGTDWLTRSGLSLSASATLPDHPHSFSQVAADAELALIGATVRDHQLSPVEILAHLERGTLTVNAECTDTLASFAIEGSAKLGDSLRGYSAEVDLRRLAADRFRLTAPAFGDMAGHVVANFKGNTLDEMHGAIAATALQAGAVRLKEASLAVQSAGGEKELRLKCDAMNATVGGRFAYKDLPLMARRMAEHLLPRSLRPDPPADEKSYDAIKECLLTFNAQWNDDGRFLHAFSKKLTVARGTRLSGSYNHSELLKIAVRSDSVRLGGVLLSDVGISGRLEDEEYRIVGETPAVYVGKGELVRDVEVRLGNTPALTRAGITWGSSEDATEGDILLHLADGQVQVERPYFRMGRNLWEIAIDSLKVAGGDRLTAEGGGISLRNADQSIAAQLKLTGSNADFVELNFRQFMLAGLSDVLLHGSSLNAAGCVDGRFSMYGFANTPYFNANLTIDSCIVNRQHLGEVKVRSNWNAELNMLNVELGSDQIEAHGWIGLGMEDPELNFAIDFDSFELALAAPFMAAFSSRFDGQLHGNFDIGGTLRRPIVLGEALVENGRMKIDATGVTYLFSDSLHITGSHVDLRRFKVMDTRGNFAFADGTIHYGGGREMTIDLDVQTDNLLILDRPRGDNFRGTVLAALRGNVAGSTEGMSVTVDARTRPGSLLTVPVSNQRRMKTQSYISFVDDSPQPAVQAETAAKKSGIPVRLDLNLTLTPDLQLELPMDFSEVGVETKASGSGALHLSIAPGESPKILGSYEIASGTMKLSMLSLLATNFSIESGSSLGFQGSFPDARFDMKAVHSQRVNLSTLTGSLSSVDNTQKYLQVENVIAIAGTLQDPTIGFDIRLPNADASVEEEVFAYIDRNSERDMINQTMSLLLRGQFYNASGSDNVNATSGLSSGYSMIATSMSNIVSDMVQIVDVDVNYKAGNELTKDQFDVNISKDWGKWYLESTLGYGGESREIESGSNNSAVLDALVGYRLNPLVHLFAYNRTNTNDYTRMELPYKQGVGLKLTKDFDRWADLFGKKKKTPKPQDKQP